jgi:hypothetical protein
MTIYHLLAFLAGAACMYAYNAYRADKSKADSITNRDGGKGEEK